MGVRHRRLRLGPRDLPRLFPTSRRTKPFLPLFARCLNVLRRLQAVSALSAAEDETKMATPLGLVGVLLPFDPCVSLATPCRTTVPAPRSSHCSRRSRMAPPTPFESAVLAGDDERQRLLGSSSAQADSLLDKAWRAPGAWTLLPQQFVFVLLAGASMSMAFSIVNQVACRAVEANMPEVIHAVARSVPAQEFSGSGTGRAERADAITSFVTQALSRQKEVGAGTDGEETWLSWVPQATQTDEEWEQACRASPEVAKTFIEYCQFTILTPDSLHLRY